VRDGVQLIWVRRVLLCMVGRAPGTESCLSKRNHTES